MRWDEVVERVCDRISANTSLALDAPLGWPQALEKALRGHRAGAALRFDADELFHRLTDDVVKKELKLKQNPMEVGADKIARTAHKALWFLDQVRERTGHKVPLASEPGQATGVAAIEVYPAATLAGRGLPTTGYKKGDEAPGNRRDLIDRLASTVAVGPSISDKMVANDDLLDAALCVVAGFDFLAEDVFAPVGEQMERAKREGWIWFKPFE